MWIVESILLADKQVGRRAAAAAEVLGMRADRLSVVVVEDEMVAEQVEIVVAELVEIAAAEQVEIAVEKVEIAAAELVEIAAEQVEIAAELVEIVVEQVEIAVLELLLVVRLAELELVGSKFVSDMTGHMMVVYFKSFIILKIYQLSRHNAK